MVKQAEGDAEVSSVVAIPPMGLGGSVDDLIFFRPVPFQDFFDLFWKRERKSMLGKTEIR